MGGIAVIFRIVPVTLVPTVKGSGVTVLSERESFFSPPSSLFFSLSPLFVLCPLSSLFPSLSVTLFSFSYLSHFPSPFSSSPSLPSPSFPSPSPNLPSSLPLPSSFPLSLSPPPFLSPSPLLIRLLRPPAADPRSHPSVLVLRAVRARYAALIGRSRPNVLAWVECLR